MARANVFQSMLIAIVLATPLCTRAAEVKLESDDHKALYSYGAQVAEQLKYLEISKEDFAVFVAGINESFAGKTRIKTDDPAQAQKLQAYYRDQMQKVLTHEDAESQKFLDAAAKKKDAEKTDSGLIYTELEAGDGEAPKPTDTVQVHYHGTLRDGTVFDSSRERGQPATFPLNGVIPCWTEGLQKMKPGGKANLVCPASIAYGENGAPPKIKPGAALNFEVELLSVTASSGTSGNPHAGANAGGAPSPH